MSKKPNKPIQPRPNTAKAVESAPTADLLDRIELFLEKNASKVFWGILVLSALLVIGMFDMKISLANDDSLYVEGGMNYSKKFFGYFFTANAPLYPMVLGLLITIFGTKLVVLKAFSAVFFLVSLYFIYKTFKGRIPYIVLFAAFFITSTNSLFLLHASYTYTECFFAMGQSVFLFIVLKLSDKADVDGIAKTYKYWIIFGLSVMVMFMLRNVAVGAYIAVVVFFMVRKQWKNMVYAILFPIVFIAVWEISKRAIWGDEVNQFAGQWKIMRRKFLFNPADPNNTEETPWGFVVRFWYNTEIYFGVRFWELLGFIKENSKIAPVETAKQNFTTLITLFLIGIGLVFAWVKKNKAVMLCVLYFGALCGVTFFSLHTEWAQSRLVMIYFPFIFIAIFYGFWKLFKTKAFKGWQFLYIVILLVFMLPNLFMTLGKIPANLKVLSKNIGGDEFYGYTPDMQNFLKASRWCARNLPEGSYVASRRAPMSFMYGDFKEFFPIYSLPSNEPDELLEYFRKNKVTHVLLAELRVDPKRYIPGRFISTMHRFVFKIAEKYPLVFEQVHQEGTTEKAEVYVIRYDKAVPAAAVPPTSPTLQGIK